MKVINGVKKVLKPFVDVPKWVGYQQFKDSVKNTLQEAKALFVTKKAERNETFEQAMVRLNLTETDLITRQREFKRLIIVFSIVGFGILAYAIYLFWDGSFKGGIASFGLTLLIFSYSFRYHFWLFQIRQRKLGCTLREWLDSGFMGDKK